jgi:hypothetical protein
MADNNFFSANGAVFGPETKFALGATEQPFTDSSVANNLGQFLRQPSSSLLPSSMTEAYGIGADSLSYATGGILPVGNSLLGGGPAAGQWKFIVSPDEISWSTSSNPQRVDMFGTNSPPVMGGAKGMRDLSLGGAIVEGFTRSKQIEDKISQLEALMNYELSGGNPFVNVPVYHVLANNKIYGDGLGSSDGGFFVIKEVSVKESIRDFTGRATRAVVDVSLMQVPAYQVESGIDQATKSVTGATSLLQKTSEQYEANAKTTNELLKQEEAAKSARTSTTPGSSRTTTAVRGAPQMTYIADRNNKRYGQYKVSGGAINGVKATPAYFTSKDQAAQEKSRRTPTQP